MDVQALYSNLDKIAVIDWVICLGYLGLVVGLGLYFSNKQEQHPSDPALAAWN